MKDTEKTIETKSTAAEQATASTHGIKLAMPIVYRASKKKGKRKYTSGLRTFQELGRGGLRAAERLTGGVDRGLTSFRTRTNSSSKKKRDGAIVDSVKNFTKGAGKALRTASKAPNDLIKRVDTKQITRQVRNGMRLVGWPLFS